MEGCGLNLFCAPYQVWYNIKVFNTPPMTTAMQFTATELEYLSSFLTFSYIQSNEEGTASDEQMLALIKRFKAQESKLNNQ